MSKNQDNIKKLESIGKKMSEAKKRIVKLESKGVKLNAPKHMRKFLDAK